MKKILEIAEKVFAIISLTFFSGGCDDILPSSVVQIVRYFIWIVSGVLLVIRWRQTLITASRSITLWILTGLVLMSFTWSEVPNFVFLNSREILQMTFFGLYIASRFSLKEQLQLVAWTLGIGAIGSVIIVFALPSVGKHVTEFPGAWRGLYGHKNELGSRMVLGLMSFSLLATNKKPNRFYAWGGFSLCLALILLCTSKTSLTLAFLLLQIVFFYRKFKWQGKITVLVLDLALLILGGIAIIVVSNWVALLTGLGRDPSLTGRTKIWGVALTKLQDHLLLGFGRGAFWAPNSKYALEAGLAVSGGFIPPHAHNGFLDLALDIGMIGFVLFIITLIFTYGLALKRGYAARNSEDVWPIVFLTYLVMSNVTESLLLYVTNIYWVLFIATVLSVKQNLRRVTD